jgi:glycosyltransferase involved in cell wall biosynthesis
MEILNLRTEPKMVTCVVTHNRPELTDLTLSSLINTSKNPDHYIIVVDNNSDQETKDVINSHDIDDKIFLTRNFYPGWACNLGWRQSLVRFPDVTLFHRSDNDIFYRAGWYEYVVKTFNLFPSLGLFGLLDPSEKWFFGTEPQVIYEREGYKYNRLSYPPGGSTILRRSLWDVGIKHGENKWGDGEAEDKILSEAVMDVGYHVAHSQAFLACHLGTKYGWNRKNQNDYQYYKRSFEDRVEGNFDDFLKS